MKNQPLIHLRLLLAIVIAALPHAAAAAPVTFWFSGTVSQIYNPSNALPAGITVGTPFSGRVAYDPARVAYASWTSYASGDISDNYFTNTSGLSILVQIGGHTLGNAANPNPTSYCGYIGIYDQFNNCDSFDLDTEHADVIVDGQSTLTDKVVPLLTMYLRDAGKTAYAAATLPTTPPTTGQFPDTHVFGWLVRLDNGLNTTVLSVNGNITTLTTNELVTLNFRRAGGNTAQLAWPSVVSGYTLETTTNLAQPNWQPVAGSITDVGLEHTVTVSTTGSQQFYRLKK